MKTKNKFVLNSVLSLFCGAALLCTGCTENVRTRSFGGNMTVALPPGQKFVNATWKQNELWYVVRPMREGEVPEAFSFKEKSRFGVAEGGVTFMESK